MKNGNGVVFGVPGSGKSYNEKSEMGQVLCFSTDDIIVIDPMSEYKDIAAAWGGQYINLSQSAENVYYVNPFHVPDVVPDIDRFVADPGMGLIRCGDKIVPFDNTMKKDSELYQLFNTNFHEIAGATR